jgi:hypothetical protein
MRCDDVRLELSARLDDAADPLLDDELDTHLAGCPECRRFSAGALRLRESVRGEEAAPVPALVGPIMEAVASRRRRPLARIGPRTVFAGIASAAALAIIALAVSVTRTPNPDRRTEAIRILRTRTLLAWTPGLVSNDFARNVERLDGVNTVTRVRSGVAWLDAWTDSSGREHRPPAGLRVPVELAAIDPTSYGRFVPGPEMRALETLGDGNVVLGDGGAALRGITRTGSLRVGDTTLRAAGVVDDALIGAHEGVVSNDTARRIGITRVRYLLVELADNVRPEDAAARIRGAVTGDEQVRVRALGETPYLRHGDAVLPQVRVKELFGEFAAADTSDGNLRVDPAWTERNITTATVPVLGRVRCHRLVVPQLRDAMRDIQRAGLASLIRPDDYGGCFFPRYLSQDAGAGISHHSWGVAFDVNVGANAFGKPPQLDPRVVDVVERWGFTWGGRWLVPDGMHFELRRRTGGDNGA